MDKKWEKLFRHWIIAAKAYDLKNNGNDKACLTIPLSLFLKSVPGLWWRKEDSRVQGCHWIEETGNEFRKAQKARICHSEFHRGGS